MCISIDEKNTFFYTDLPPFFDDFDKQIASFSQESDTFSYITQDFETELFLDDDDPTRDIFSEIDAIQFYFDTHNATAA